MKALLINGSPRPNGCTFTALTELANTLEAEGIETEIVHVGNKDIRGCIACRRCHSTGSNKCVFDDIVNEVAPKLAEADAFVIGAPVYFGSPAGGAISFMDRLFFSTLNIDKTMKVGASVVTCRRGGNTASYDVLNKYFTMCGMPVASSQYWNMVYGRLCRGGQERCRGLADHAHPWPQHGLFDEEYPDRQATDRPARKRTCYLHKLPSLRKCSIFLILCCRESRDGNVPAFLFP